MNQLFKIMRKWLWHDKKRTLLTAASITLSVFLISFVGFCMNTGLNALHAQAMYEDPWHVTISPKTLEQVKVLDGNVAWENREVSAHSYPFADKATLESVLAEGSGYFPDVTINGISQYNNDTEGAVLTLKGSDGKTIEGMEWNERPFPENPHEVVVSTMAAHDFGLEKGGTMTIRLLAREGKLYYGEVDEMGETVRDSEGNIVFHEDTDGSKLSEMYDSIYGIIADDYRSYGEGGSGLIDTFRRLIYSNDERTNERSGIADINMPPMYVKFTGEPKVMFEYTATVKDIVSGGSGIEFYVYDTDILPAFGGAENLNIEYSVRVKEDIDAESAAITAAKGIGIYTNESSGYSLNSDLLILEGRQFEYIEHILEFFAVFIIVMGLFVFLARLIVNNAFEISAAYRTEQYGALKTVGASDKQIFMMIMLECAMYMAVALPVGMGLAVLFGKGLLERIREIKIFDPVMGEGKSDLFFIFKLSPVVMGLTFACALFCIFFSAYADALRVKRMPPIRSAGYSSSKRRIKKTGRWLSRRLFGYPFGFAVKCISKQKVRFAVTLLAALVSGTFIISIGCIARYNTVKAEAESVYGSYMCDIEVEDYRGYGRNALPDTKEAVEQIKKYYDELNASGYYDEIILNSEIYIPGKDRSEHEKLLSEDYRELCQGEDSSNDGIIVRLISRESYEKYIKSDISYDELAASGKALLCNSVYEMGGDEGEWLPEGVNVIKRYKDKEGFEYDILDIKIFDNDNISSMSFTHDYTTKDKTLLSITETVEFAGLYTSERIEFSGFWDYYFNAILPIDNVNVDFRKAMTPELMKYNQHQLRQFDSSFLLNAKKGMEAQASEYVVDLFSDEDVDIMDNISTDTFSDNVAEALKVAGIGFSAVLAAVVLLNIFSTMSANMINRRRDLSMMRSCGMSMRQVSLSLVIESCIYSVITAVVSSVQGWLIAGSLILLFRGDDPTMVQMLRYCPFPFVGAFLLFAVVMLVMAAAYLPALLMMNRSFIAEEIRTEI